MPTSICRSDLFARREGLDYLDLLLPVRHTFLTRLGQSGRDVWTLARVAGHSSIAISARYVHPSEDAVLEAMERLGGHNSGHSEKLALLGKSRDPLLTT